MNYLRPTIIGLLALGVLTAAVLAAIALRGSGSEAFHLSPVPSFHVDIGASSDPTSTGNSYVEDPNGDFDASDQLMSIDTITPCVRRDVSDFGNIGQVRIVTDIIIQNAQEMVGGDVRIDFDPSLIQFFSATLTPFPNVADFVTGFSGQPIGLLNLPIQPSFFGSHRNASAFFAQDNTNGVVFLGGVYSGLSKEFKFSSESGPTVDGGTSTLPDRNAGEAPNGGVFVRVKWDLQAASDGQDVLIDLTTGGPSFTGGGDITAGSGFLTLIKEDPGFTQEIIPLGNPNLFDGVVSVNKAIPSPCPPPPPAAHDVEAKHIGGTGGPTLKLFQDCDSDRCTVAQVHRLLVRNHSDHTEDIRVNYTVVGWPIGGVPGSGPCTVNGIFVGGQITVSDSVEIAVPSNASRNTKETVTFSCKAAEAAFLTGTPIIFRLQVLHLRDGSGSADDDAVNDILTQSKIIK